MAKINRVETRGLGVAESSLQRLRDQWRDLGVDQAFNHAGTVLKRHAWKPMNGSVELSNRIVGIGKLIVSPMRSLSTPRIAAFWTYETYDPLDYDIKLKEWGKTRYNLAYSFGLSERGFYAKYEDKGVNFLGTTRKIKDHDELIHMIDEHLQMGREGRLREWGKRR